MNKNREQTRKNYTVSDASFPCSPSNNQNSLLLARGSNEGATSDKAAYEDISVPYVPVPENNSPSWQMAETPSSPRLAPAIPREPEVSGSIVLLGIILGAGLGALLAYFTKVSPLSWAWTGAVAGGALGLVVFLLYPVLHAREAHVLLLDIFEHWPW